MQNRNYGRRTDSHFLGWLATGKATRRDEKFQIFDATVVSVDDRQTYVYPILMRICLHNEDMHGVFYINICFYTIEIQGALDRHIRCNDQNDQNRWAITKRGKRSNGEK